MAQRTICDAMAAVPRLMIPRPSALALARPLFPTRQAWVRFSSSEAAAVADEPEPAQAQPQQQHYHQQQSQNRSPPAPGDGLQSTQDFWSAGVNSSISKSKSSSSSSSNPPTNRWSNVPSFLSRPAPIEGSPRGSVTSNPWESPYPQFRTGAGGSFHNPSASDREKFDMLGLTPKKGSGLGLGELLSGMDGGELELKQIKPTPVRLKPVSGKTIHCAAGMDPARAFSALNRLTSLEKTALTQRRQRFHERPGLKRKRLKSERWRSRFAVGFAATVKRVQHLAQQGW